MIGRNDLCWCQSGKKWKKCHYPELPLRSFEERKELYFKKYQIQLKTEKEIEGIRKASKLAAFILQKLCEKVAVGVTTEELHLLAMALHKEATAIPAPLGYGSPPFPKSICTSLNEVICHGIPNSAPLQEGDILNIDVTPILNGYYGDCSAMVMVGEVSEEKKRVCDAAKEALIKAIECVKPGALVSEIGQVITNVAKEYKCSVVDQFVGHGVGVGFHEMPQIPHHMNSVHIPLAAGMTFTIEPMLNIGAKEGVIDEEDGWTARTIDNKPSAQWEHTLLVTENGCEVLTKL